MAWTKEQEKLLRDGLAADKSFAELAQPIGKKQNSLVQYARSRGWKRTRSICQHCGIRKKQQHSNSKWCKPCALARRRRPYANLHEWQKEIIHRYDGKKTLEEIGRLTKTSKPTVTRYRRMAGLQLRSDTYPEKVIKDVCEYYFIHGIVKTKKKFSKVKVRSITERHYAKLGYPPRQKPWTGEQLIMLARMAGLISMERQARYFNRPCAHRGSIRSAWVKKFGVAGGQVNGLSWSVARHFVKRDCYIVTQFWWQRNHVARNPHSRKIVLWVDMEKNLKNEVPAHLRSAISAMAKFQRWLHGRNVRANIKRMMEEI